MMEGKNTMKIAACLLHLILIFIPGMGQDKIESQYPRGYFRNPLGIPISVTANYGELRPNHWHMGLDIRTNQKENLPVYAAADGYISYIGIRPLSFGRFIMMNHPNGLSTFYAHLNDFSPELEEYVSDQQQKKESWAVELEPDPGVFPVRKGDRIAYSGNTGASQGPHLHFEIRDTKSGRSLNPLLFGFPVSDNIPPVITRLAIYDRSTSTHLQTPNLFSVKKTDSGYSTRPGSILTGSRKISFAISAYDRVNGSSSPNGIYSAIFYLDEIPQAGFILDNMDYPESVYVNAQIDYRHKFYGGPYLQHLSRLPGNKARVFHEIENENGVIELSDTMEHSVRIEVTDAYDNISELFFIIRYKDSLASGISGQNPQKKFTPGYVNVVEEKDFEVYIPETCLYDTVQPYYFRQENNSAGSVSSLHRLNDPSIPVHDDIIVRIKPSTAIAEQQLDKVIIERNWYGRRTVKKGEIQNGWIIAGFSDFGNFQAFVDLVPPQVNAPGGGKDTLDLSRSKRIVFTPTDNYGIQSFRAELNGKWLMFTNDKARSFVYIFDEQCPYGVHELKVKVEDIAGNITEKSWWFKRYPYTPPKVKKKVVKRKKK